MVSATFLGKWGVSIINKVGGCSWDELWWTFRINTSVYERDSKNVGNC